MKIKKIKNIKILSLLLTILLTIMAITPLVATATDKYYYDIDIPKLQGLTHTSYTLYRNTNSKTNKWAVKLSYSNEHTKDHSDGSAKTATTFWLGVNNPNGINPAGSSKVTVTEGAGYKKSDAFSNASLKNVYLYASDNHATNAAYDVDGYWYAFTS